MLCGVTRHGGLPDLPGWVTLSAGVTICHVNVSRWGNPPSRGRGTGQKAQKRNMYVLKLCTFPNRFMAEITRNRNELFSNAQSGQTSLVEHCTSSGCNSCTGLNFSFQVFLFYFCESNIRYCKVRSQIIFIYINSHLTYMIFIYSVKTEKKISHSPGKKKRRKELITRCLSQCSESILNVHISNAPLNTRYWTYRDARGMCE